jgi:cystathionine gamma-synthase
LVAWDDPAQHGTSRPPLVNFEIVGPVGHPTVVVLGGISAGRHVCSSQTDCDPGWWEKLVGTGKTIDTNRFRVLGIDWVGGGQPGPDTNGEAIYTTTDQATAIARVLDHLEIPVAQAIVGSSYGGMVALAFAAQFPKRTSHVVCISAAHRSHPMATALRTLQRRVVRLGCRTGQIRDSLSIARGIAMTTYRTADEFATRFETQGKPDAVFPVEGYLINRGDAFADHFDEHAFLQLSESLDLHDVEPAQITTPLTLVAVDSDTLVPPWQMRELAAGINTTHRFHEIRSTFGHDAFLKETDKITSILDEVFREDCGVHTVTATRAVRAAIGFDREHGAVMPPVHLSANFTFRGIGRARTYDYTRSGNPTRDLLANAVAELEGGVGSVITSSGMAAITAVTQLVRPDQTVLAPLDCYGGTRRLLDALATQHRFAVEYAWLNDAEALHHAFARHKPALILVETPSNPLLRITDLELVRDLCNTYGTLFVADNTFLSPALQTPIAHGADIVVHSTTKFLNGHSDVVGGAVVSKDVAIHQQVAWWANCLGLSGAPFDSYLTLRGLRTLHARTAVHTENATAVVELLAGDDRVAAVYHPSLPTHPGHAVAQRQQRGPGSLVSFGLDGGLPAVRAFVTGLEHFSLAESLGGVESLVAHPASMTHAAMSISAREAAGIGEGLLRLSVGIEDRHDLIADLAKALDRVERSSCPV